METNAGAVLRLYVEIGEPKLVGDIGCGTLTILPITGGGENAADVAVR